jgi:hypothetical protein
MNRVPLALMLAALLALAGCSGDSRPSPRAKVVARDAVNPCALAFKDQQIATPLEARSPAVQRTQLDGHLVAGLAADGVCFDVFYEVHAPGWKVKGYRVSADQGGVRYSSHVPDRVFQTQFDEKTKLSTKPLPGLYVPLRGCVDVSAHVDLVGPHGQPGTYAGRATYGRGCAKAPGTPAS